MFSDLRSVFCITTLAILVTGCEPQTSPPSSSTESSPAHHESDDHQHDDHGDADVTAAMAKLSPEDCKEAESQKYCSVMGSSLLGSMGKPLKLDVKGEAVFVCCAGCKSRALKDPDATLATVAKLKADNSMSKP